MRCFCAKTRRTARLLSRYYEDRLQTLHLTPAQFELLSELAGHPNRPQAEMAESMGLDQTTLSRNIKTMVAHGWVDASSTAKDRRRTHYSLTAKGKEMWNRALPLWQQAQDHLQSNLGDDAQGAWAMMERLAQAVAV